MQLPPDALQPPALCHSGSSVRGGECPQPRILQHLRHTGRCGADWGRPAGLPAQTSQHPDQVLMHTQQGSAAGRASAPGQAAALDWGSAQTWA